MCGGQAQAIINATKAAAIQAQREATKTTITDAAHDTPAAASGNVRTLTLPSRSVVTLSVTGNLLRLHRDERNFMFDLRDERDFVFALVDEFNDIERMLASQARQAASAAHAVAVGEE